MPNYLSFSGLHLQCRLSIAELNGNINMLRIYHDYIQELSTKEDRPELKRKIMDLEQQFPVLRREIDDLRNELHLLKMKFATYMRENKAFAQTVYKSTGHSLSQKRFASFRKMFEKMKKELNGVEKAFPQ